MPDLSELQYDILEDTEHERQGGSVALPLVFKRTAKKQVSKEAFITEIRQLVKEGFLKLRDGRVQNTMKGSLAANREI